MPRELSRRAFLRTSGASAGAASVALAQPAAAGMSPGADKSCILLFLTGGPGQLDTFDLKPAAPSSIRGPFKPSATSVPGIQICEHLPRLAQSARLYSLIRSVHHTAAPIHETGFQLMQTGRVCRLGQEHPHFGAVASHVHGPRQAGVPAFMLLPGPMGSTGVSISHGQTAGALGEPHAPRTLHHTGLGAAALQALDLRRERPQTYERYGAHEFGQACLRARRLVEAGVRCVTVNMFDTVFDKATWDCHADGGSLPATLDDYRRTLCPMFDQACSALFWDLHDRGLLASTLVLALGEFGRTPYLNARGGRDHWPGVWSILVGGGGLRGGQIIGASDALGGEPRDRPVTPADVAATIYRTLAIDPALLVPGPDGRPQRLTDGTPIAELMSV